MVKRTIYLALMILFVSILTAFSFDADEAHNYCDNTPRLKCVIHTSQSGHKVWACEAGEKTDTCWEKPPEVKIK